MYLLLIATLARNPLEAALPHHTASNHPPLQPSRRTPEATNENGYCQPTREGRSELRFYDGMPVLAEGGMLLTGLPQNNEHRNRLVNRGVRSLSELASS